MCSIEVITVPAQLPAPFGYKYDEPMEVIPTGSFALDRALGIGGLPRGRLTEILGPTTPATALALSCIAQAQKQGGVAAFVDVEKSLSLSAARDLGVDCSRMLLSQPDCGEQAMDVTEALVHSGQCSIVVVNGLERLVSPDDTPFLQHRMMSRAVRKLASKAHQTGTTVVYLNGSDKAHPAGDSLKFYASVRIKATVIGTIKVDDTVEGARVKYKVIKNKLAPPFATAEVDVLAKGFCKEREVFDLALAQGVIFRSGAYYRINLGDGDGTLIGHGRLRSARELVANPELLQTIIDRLTPGNNAPTYEDTP